MLKLDDKDTKILGALREHGNWSYKQISWKTGIPTTTVHNRVKKLENSGILKKYTVDIDYSKIGKGILAYILVRADYKSIEKFRFLMKFLEKKSVEGVIQEFSRVTGDYDIIVKVRFESMKELENFLFSMVRNTKSIYRTVTMVSIAENS
ncbi:MAG: Lrp/AsnC family transcriptional regulator [Candidatus Aenigmarchaeota archaeon]|nr:Lrp/AsnC family transcriptional regulator [Candidatus Aenigmarchaeota archaeon]